MEKLNDIDIIKEYCNCLFKSNDKSKEISNSDIEFCEEFFKNYDEIAKKEYNIVDLQLLIHANVSDYLLKCKEKGELPFNECSLQNIRDHANSIQKHLVEEYQIEIPSYLIMAGKFVELQYAEYDSLKDLINAQMPYAYD